MMLALCMQRASYCSLINLNESTVSDSRRVMSNSDVSLSSSVKSSFSKFDQLSKKTVLHVRSVDASKVQKQFNESASTSPEALTNCKACGKQVFVMEQIKAEKAVWHKNCFRCKECSKQLTVDTYSSNEGDIFCKPHFRELFKPKAVVEDSPEPNYIKLAPISQSHICGCLVRRRKPELIIRENQPVELPPDVVRASDKPDLGLEELSSLNVKSRFQVFEKAEENKSADIEKSPSSVNVKRSPSILSKLAKFQAKGMDIGVTDESLNGIPYEESSTSSEEEEDDGEGDEENGDIVKSRRTVRERPMSFSKMEDVKSRWETGSATKKEERREERKQEISTIRSRLFLGKQGKMKEMYEQAVKESEQPAARRGAEVRSEKAKSIKEKFERGETLVSDEDGEENDKKIKDEDLGVFEAGISKKSRSLFLELDASAAKTAQQTPPRQALQSGREGPKKREVLTNQVSSEVVKASDKLEDVQVETADISSKFKFFETYKAPEKQRKAFRITPPREGQVKMDSPEREVYRDPDVVRAEDPPEGDELQHSMTTSKMLSIFRQMEEKAQREDVPDGPKPLKCFTPPPDYKPESGSSGDDRSDEDEEDDDDEEEEDEEDDGVIRSSVKAEDEFLKAAKEAAKAKTLRAKFEHWEEQENNINAGGGNINPTLLESEHESIESTKSLRARFESLRKESEAPKEKPRPKVNRFVYSLIVLTSHVYLHETLNCIIPESGPSLTFSILVFHKYSEAIIEIDAFEVFGLFMLSMSEFESTYSMELSVCHFTISVNLVNFYFCKLKAKLM
ncbi:LIM domain-containing protein 2 [Frankliniella fusca]|uniref:LIM domain-containing protein 2 n=1 Tax=Frankliniella fusca TaxID=407009 RepID=A0AAE1HH94_9NEOP|nr:LIM domain-containing protein 2 [Frankliniella fusca]